jgi:alkylated DNA repair dioxygenase AlkB
MSIEHTPDFLNASEATRLLDLLRLETSWQQFKAGFGQLRPRLEAWYGDAGAKYASYNRGMSPLPWTDALLSLRAKVSKATGATFNGVLLNLYRNERDSVAPHADNEPEFGVNPVIASVSLGATRRFVLRHNRTSKTRTIGLTHGSLLVMAGNTQSQYTHAVPKESTPRTERINLTFRRIL